MGYVCLVILQQPPRCWWYQISLASFLAASYFVHSFLRCRNMGQFPSNLSRDFWGTSEHCGKCGYFPMKSVGFCVHFPCSTNPLNLRDMENHRLFQRCQPSKNVGHDPLPSGNFDFSNFLDFRPVDLLVIYEAISLYQHLWRCPTRQGTHPQLSSKF